MSNDSTKIAREARPAAITVRLTLSDMKRLSQLIARDDLSRSEFLRRAIQAYDLMYSRDN